MIVSDADLVNKVWTEYYSKYLDTYFGYFMQQHIHAECHKDYNFVPRRSTPARQFEEWLFEHGASIRQIKRRRYLEFALEEQATFFLLQVL